MPDAICREPAVLRLPETWTDGAIHYREIPADIRAAAGSELDFKQHGILRDLTVFLIRCAEAPVPGARLRRAGGREYELQSVRPCRDLDGRLICYRCAAV